MNKIVMINIIIHINIFAHSQSMVQHGVFFMVMHYFSFHSVSSIGLLIVSASVVQPNYRYL